MSTKWPCLVHGCKSEALRAKFCHTKGQPDVMPSSKHVFAAFDNLDSPLCLLQIHIYARTGQLHTNIPISPSQHIIVIALYKPLPNLQDLLQHI